MFDEELFQSVVEDLFEHSTDFEGEYQAKIEVKGLDGIPALVYDLFDCLGVRFVFDNGVPYNCYDFVDDVIVLKPLSSFANEEQFVSIALHELGHWTGHKSRLNRPTVKSNVTCKEQYIEEVTAEIVAQYICEFFNVPNTFRTNERYDYIFRQLAEAAVIGENFLEIFFMAIDYAAEALMFIDTRWNE